MSRVTTRMALALLAAVVDETMEPAHLFLRLEGRELSRGAG